MTLVMELLIVRMIAGNGTQAGGRELYAQTLDLAGFPRYDSPPTPPFAQIEATIGRWEDALAIHDWFVRTGRTRVAPASELRVEVSARHLRDLRFICDALLVTPGLSRYSPDARSRLPGMFSPSDLATTLVIIDRALSVAGDVDDDLDDDDLQRAIEAKDVFFYYEATRE